jgi:putative spermidine/putrescine transport system permease protein
MTTVAAPSASAATARGAGTTRSRRPRAVWLGLLPFLVYVVLFLAVPSIIAVASGFITGTGAFTLETLKVLGQPQILNQFLASFAVSAVTAVLGAILGAVICFALIGTRPDGALRSVVDSASSVLAQFGGVMLAFAFIALIGTQGLLTKLLVQAGLTENVLKHFGNNGTRCRSSRRPSSEA